jgi:hypothetical protein
MEISAGFVDDDDDDPRSSHKGKTRRKELDKWIDDSLGGGEGKGKARSKVCPTDGRPVAPGFVLADQEELGFKKDFWAPPTPPRNFRGFHRYLEDMDTTQLDALR